MGNKLLTIGDEVEFVQHGVQGEVLVKGNGVINSILDTDYVVRYGIVGGYDHCLVCIPGKRHAGHPYAKDTISLIEEEN